MARRRFEIDEALIRPGTYFNPQTEIMIVVDDSPTLDQEIFNMEEFEGADWVLVAEELPVDESRRDELFEGFQASWHGGDGRQTRSLEEEDELGTEIDEDEDEERVGFVEEE